MDDYDERMGYNAPTNDRYKKLIFQLGLSTNNFTIHKYFYIDLPGNQTTIWSVIVTNFYITYHTCLCYPKYDAVGGLVAVRWNRCISGDYNDYRSITSYPNLKNQIARWEAYTYECYRSRGSNNWFDYSNQLLVSRV